MARVIPSLISGYSNIAYRLPKLLTQVLLTGNDTGLLK